MEIGKNTAIVDLNKYVKLINERDKALEEIKCKDEMIRKLTELKNNLMNHILLKNLSEYRISSYSLEECLDIKGYGFAMADSTYLNKLGITYDEMKDFIKMKYEEMMKEEEEEQNDNIEQ